jgi:hypothetical protein
MWVLSLSSFMPWNISQAADVITKKKLSELRGKYRCQAGATCRQECRAAISSSPPPAHAGIALSSLPTMLINRLGCQFKHSYLHVYGMCCTALQFSNRIWIFKASFVFTSFTRTLRITENPLTLSC